MIARLSGDSLASIIPECLRQRPQWVVWRFVTRNGKPTKVPFNCMTGDPADATEPQTWSTFDNALSAFELQKQYEGVGFVFSKDDPYCGVDLDDCVDANSGNLKPWGTRLVAALNSYSEISPSGTGVKVFLNAAKPGDRCRKPYEDGEVEMYDQGRFFTVTGNRLVDSSAEVEPRQVELDLLYKQVFGTATPLQAKSIPSPAQANSAPCNSELSDEQIVKLASHSKNGNKFSALWSGQWSGHFKSQSEADSSLIFTLAFYTKDAPQIDRMFRTSGLFRPKWDEKHGAKTYGQMTIEKALSQVSGQYGVPAIKPARPAVTPEWDGDGGGQKDSNSVDLVALGSRDPKTNKLVLSPTKTLPTANAYVQVFHDHPEGKMLHCYGGMLLAWRGNHYAEIETAAVRHRLQPWLHESLRYVLNKKSKAFELFPFDSNPTTVNAALETIQSFVHLPASVSAPAWLSDSEGRPDPRELLPCRSGNLHVPTGEMFPPTPALFNINALDFDYDPNAKSPERWLTFLNQLWGEDLESIQLLQEWMGYCLIADTAQQKMLLLVGPKRSGKGTIARILSKLVGVANIAGPTTSSLAGSFGLQPLIGKSLAIVSDARFSGENIGIVVERLLCISGEDTLTIDRKFLSSVTMKLSTRFMFLTNELPRMNDASGALAGRFLILKLVNSFYGHEDFTLTDQLLDELPGILLWAIQGLKRLRARGYFVQPQSVAETMLEMEDLASPVSAFVREHCTLGNDYRVLIDDLYEAWKGWCDSDGRISVTTKQTFGRDITAAFPGISRRRGSIKAFYQGIDLLKGRTA